MQIKIWGARGSLPTPHSPPQIEDRVRDALENFFDTGHKNREEIEAFLRRLPIHQFGGYGGNTPCIEVRTPEIKLIVDGGSGLRNLGYELMKGPCAQGQGEVHILFTHFHWDHLMGLPFFTPIFIPGNKIHVYAVQPELPEVFATVFKKPFFPVPLQGLGAKIFYHSLEPRKPIEFGRIKVTPYQLDHPDPCWGYKFECGGKVYSHCVDTECKRVTRDELGPDLPLYQGVDLMTFDAQYTLIETIEKVNWGHAASWLGLDIAMREGVKEIVFMHHDPASSDEKIATVETQTRRYYQSRMKQEKRSEGTPDESPHIHQVKWSFAREEMVIDV